jgi:hypothetical protein
MSNYNPNKILAAGRFFWDGGGVLQTIFNDGFLAPINLNGVGAFPAAGAAALVFDNVTSGYAPTALLIEVQADGGAPLASLNALTFTGPITDLDIASGAQQPPSGASPNSQGRPWIYVQTARLRVDNTAPPAVVTCSAANAAFRITCYVKSLDLQIAASAPGQPLSPGRLCLEVNP